MLAKLLSGNSFLIQILFGMVFLAVFFLKLQPENYDGQSILGIFFYLTATAISTFFFQFSSLIKYQGLAIWYFLIWMLAFSELAFDYKIGISLVSCTLIFWRLLAAQKTFENNKFLFDVGILLSISGFFYPPSLFLIGFLLFLFLYMRFVNLKGFLLFLLGFLLPIAVGIQILYLTNQTDWLQSYAYSFCLDFWKFPVWGLIPIAVLVFISWFDHLAQSSTQDINKRQKYFLTFLYYLNWIIVFILFGGQNLSLLAFLGLPIGVFLTRFTQYQKSEIRKELILWLYALVMLGFYFRNEISEIYTDLLGNVAF